MCRATFRIGVLLLLVATAIRAQEQPKRTDPSAGQKVQQPHTPVTVLTVNDGTAGLLDLNGATSGYTGSGVFLQALTAGKPNVSAKIATADATSSFSVFNSADMNIFCVNGLGRVGIGIGTCAPGAPLEVDSGAVYEGIRLFSGNAGSYTAYSLGRTSADLYLGVAAGPGHWVNNSAAGDIVMRSQGGKLLFTTSSAGATNDLTVSSNNVGIGMPAPGEKLDVNGGNIRVNNSAGAYNGMLYSGDTNWGFAVVHPSVPADDYEVRLNYVPNAGGNRKAGIYNVSTSSYVLYADTNANPNVIVPTGKVGIGVGANAPHAQLQVAGDIQIGSNSSNGYSDLHIYTETTPDAGYQQTNTIVPVTVPASGVTTKSALHIRNATATGMGTNQLDLIVDGNITSKYQDVAEWVSADRALDPATVVVLDRSHEDRVTPSSTPYDTRVAGVVSSTPGLILGVGADGKEKIATTGRVKVKVDAMRAPIEIGDLLVTSDVSGTAMKSEPIEVAGVKIHRPGTVIGKALQALPSGRGEILVLLSLQ